MTKKISSPNAVSLAANRRRLFQSKRTYSTYSRQDTGIRKEKVTVPVMVSRYFSRNTAHSTSRKWELRSASLSAIGVATSPGISVIAAEAAAEAKKYSEPESDFFELFFVRILFVLKISVFYPSGKFFFFYSYVSLIVRKHQAGTRQSDNHTYNSH